MRRLLSALLSAHALSPPRPARRTSARCTPKPLPPLAHPDDPHNAAKQVFGREMSPTEAQTRSIGFYSHGCLAGAESLPLDGDTWRVMRVSRNRYWGNPETIAFLERFSKKAADKGIWPGILVGDISPAARRPDADRPRLAPDRPRRRHLADADAGEPDARSSARTMSAVDMVRPDGLGVEPDALVGAAGRHHPRRGRGAAGDAHLRQRGDQEGAVRDTCRRALDEQGAAVVGPRLSFPRAAALPRGAKRPARIRDRRRPATAATSR